MSGEVSRKKKYNKGKSKKDDVQLDSNGGLCVVSGIENWYKYSLLTPDHNPSILGKKEDNVGGASCLTKFIFTVVFVIFILASSLYLLDYKSGKANQLISELSPEVFEALEKAQEGINLALEKLKIRETLGTVQKSLAPALEKLKIQETLGTVQKSLATALEKVRESSAPALDQLKTWVAKASDEIEALSQKVNLGEKTLADYLFAARRKVRQTSPGPGQARSNLITSRKGWMR